MIDPSNITNYYSDDYELEEVLLFWVCAAGKNAQVAAEGLDGVFLEAESWLPPVCQDYSPFETIKFVGIKKLPDLLRRHGIGCYNNKARTMIELAKSGLDLRKCSRDDLLNVYGVGMKTASCFIMHSRKNARCAGLDTHILSYMKDQGYVAPKATPQSKKKYLFLEEKFLALADLSGKSVAEFDLDIWKRYSGRGR
jgi:hypothetical protein